MDAADGCAGDPTFGCPPYRHRFSLACSQVTRPHMCDPPKSYRAIELCWLRDLRDRDITS
eukprot:5420693-Prymnesium_polylepis.1